MVAGVYLQLRQVSLSILLIPGMLGFSYLLPWQDKDILLVLIASVLVASIPFAVQRFIETLKLHATVVSSLSKVATRLALISLLISQLLGLLPFAVLYYLYWSVLAILSLIWCGQLLRPSIVTGVLNRVKVAKKLRLYVGLVSIVLGGAGSEWLRDNPSFRESNIKHEFGFLGLFILLPASLGFVFPALPVPLVELQPSLSVWMIGYICWPLSLVVFGFALLGFYLVKRHENLTDLMWLDYIFTLFILAYVLRFMLT